MNPKNEHGYCPHCGADWDGEDIPKESQEFYSGSKWGRQISIEDPFFYDGVIGQKCPDCGEMSGYGAGNLESSTPGMTVFEKWMYHSKSQMKRIKAQKKE